MEEVDLDRKQCRALECVTVLAATKARLEVKPHDCDSKLSNVLDGELELADFVHVWDSKTSEHGFHSARFRWKGRDAVFAGELSGMTNAGTHRLPIFKACERCRIRGVDEGRLCGTVEKTEVKELEGAQVFGIYRLKYAPAAGSQLPGGRLAGSFEGLLVRPCPD
jgi:hypothetical protein